MRRPVWLRSRLSGKSQPELDPAGGLPASPSPDMGLPEPGAAEPSAAEPVIDELEGASAGAVGAGGRHTPAADLALAEAPVSEQYGGSRTRFGGAADADTALDDDAAFDADTALDAETTLDGDADVDGGAAIDGAAFDGDAESAISELDPPGGGPAGLAAGAAALVAGAQPAMPAGQAMPPGEAAPAGGPAPAAPAPVPGANRQDAGATQAPAGLAMPELVTKLHRLVLAWAWRRSLGLSSACGIGIALAVCAATWFSAGTRTDIIRGAVALWAGYLIIAAARNLGRWQFASRTARSPALRPPGPASWLAALGSRLAECIVYAGLAAGATAEHWSGVWALAIAVLAMAGIRDLMTTCSTPPGLSQPSGLGAKLLGAFLTMPFGGRVLLVGIAAPIWGARAALLALLEWSIIAVGYGIAGRAVSAVSGRQDRPGEAGEAPSGEQSRSPEAAPRGRSSSPDPDDRPGTEPDGAPAMLVRLRDDGVLARTLGTLVRGNLLPLPPAVLGLVAVAAFAILGLHALPGILMLGPAIVMLLAAPGSSSHHAGRFDWLVPVLLLGAQLLYLSAAGLASGVPGAVVFVLCGAVLLRYCDLAFPGRPVMLARRRPSADSDDEGSRVTEMGTSLGWEGRMLVIGAATALGIGLVVYLVLSAYLVWLIAAKILASSVVAMPKEGEL